MFIKAHSFMVPVRTVAASIATICLTLGAGHVSSARAQVQPNNEVLFVLDGSNSMWGQINGQSKISIAKDVMTDLISDWDAKVPVGLMIYGHRRKKDCQDIELVSMPGKVDRKRLISKVQSIKPQGKTPISLSLTMAHAQLLLKNLGKFPKPKSSLVLVSDGLETCGSDPCANIDKREVNDPGTEVHVIGFDLTDAESKALRCIADKSGGKFFRANNANELQKALHESVKIASGGQPSAPLQPAPPVPAATPAKPKPALLLYGKLCESCKRLEPLDVNWTIQGETGKQIYYGLGVLYPRHPKLAPGTYKVKARYKSSVLVRDAELVIGKDGKQVGAVNLKGGAASMFAYATDEKTIAANPIFYQFHPMKNGKASGKALDEAVVSKEPVWLPAGRYKVVASHDQIKESTEIEIFPGETTTYDFDMRVGYFQPSAVLAEGGKPLGRFMDYAIFKTEADAKTKRTIDNIGFMLGTFKKKKPLKPGRYYVKAMLSYNRGTVVTTKIFPFDIKTNEVTKPVFDMQAGVLDHKVKSKSGKRISNIDYVRESDGKRQAFYNLGSSFATALPKGRYFLRVLTSSGEKYNTKPFEIQANKKTTLEVAVP
ncbi:vWA domain-containing protein [Cohaesibacter gelatinilyticus]|uniref:Mg-chelatase subunit ChlD n=1 Tax=Cohaesibacter gelatinilyticus TaxID=372072 RepID=A0A285PDS0_9HYPH|nr:VWA domain-containing protein [Cohaesibacter gelatinilyticus]SNZ19588.1 Mg-chelatase subunit ChlD [Cohaesibacter gelatinilyticus]